jgi:hypothetical protein
MATPLQVCPPWRSRSSWPARQIRSADRFPVFMVIVSRHGPAAVRAGLVGDVAESVEQMGPGSSAAVFGVATADVRLA